jgi:hypothetical protein
MAQQAFVLVEIGEAWSALDLVNEALKEAGSAVPARFHAWLRAAQAEVSAAAGDRLVCQRAFDKAATLLPSGVDASDAEMPYIVLNDAHLARWRGNCLARLGDPSALDDLYLALNSRGVVSTRAEAGLHCDIAHALVLNGERGDARRHATEARRLARRAGSVRQRRRVERLALIA